MSDTPRTEREAVLIAALKATRWYVERSKHVTDLGRMKRDRDLAWIDSALAGTGTPGVVEPGAVYARNGRIIGYIRYEANGKWSAFTTVDVYGEYDTYREADDALLKRDRPSRKAPPHPDAGRMDWLEQQYVTVRTPLRYGSRARFHTLPDEEGEPSDIRTKIDAAMKPTSA